MSTRTRWAILAFALLGFGFASSSAWVHYRSLTDPAYISPCDISARLNCTALYKSRYGSVAGVPVALGGMFWFGLVALVAAFSKPNDRTSAAGGYLFALSIVGLAVALYLGYVSSFVLGTWCLLCIGTYVSVAAIFFLSSAIHTESMSRLPMRLASDFASALSRPVVLAATVIFLAGAASAVAFFPKEGAMAERAERDAQAAATTAVSADVRKAFSDAWSRQPRVDLGVKADGAKIVIVKFNDYECPACAQAETAYQPVIARFLAAHPGSVKYVMKDWPWNKTCNFTLAQTLMGHDASCDAAVAARVARDRGKYDEMAAWLFSHQETTSQAVRQEAQRILGPFDFDREYAAKLPDIRRDVADGGVLKINSTPTSFINGVRVEGVMQAQAFELALELELNRP
jgi:uncharacterized membrane protein/protein-disulfide isomerase